eukprot:2295518-Rhodomonas_salina.1
MEVSNNGIDFSVNGPVFLYQLLPVIVKVEPFAVWSCDSSTITVFGQHLDYVGSSFLLGGRDELLCIVQIHSSALCTIPSRLQPGNYTITVVIGETSSPPDSPVVHVLVLQAISSLYPTSGPASGGSLVQVFGVHLDQFAAGGCKFGTHFVRAHQTSTFELACVTPPVVAPGAVDVALCMTESDCLSSSRMFAYVPTPDALLTKPPKPLCANSPIITVIGNNFDESLECKGVLDGIKLRTSTLLVSSSELRCNAAFIPAESGLMELEVMQGNIRVFWVSRECEQPPEIRNILPPSILASLQQTVTVFGGRFRDPMECSVGAKAFAANVLSSSELSCPLLITDPGNYSLLVISETATSLSTITIQVEADRRTSILNPSMGPMSGGTFVHVETLFPSADVRGVAFHKLGVVAWIESDSQLMIPASAEPGVMSISLLSRQESILQTSTFLFVEDVQLHSISPTSAFAAGGSIIRLVGLHFSTRCHSCMFGNTSVPARLVSSSMLYCALPPHSPASVRLSMPCWTGKNDVDFEIVERPEVLSVVPSRSYLDGNSAALITVIGANFLRESEISCKMGSHSLDSATWLSSSSIRCSISFLQPGNSTIAVTLDGTTVFGTGQHNVESLNWV